MRMPKTSRQKNLSYLIYKDKLYNVYKKPFKLLSGFLVF